MQVHRRRSRGAPVEPRAVRQPVAPDVGTEGVALDRKNSRGEVLSEAAGVFKGAVKGVFK